MSVTAANALTWLLAGLRSARVPRAGRADHGPGRPPARGLRGARRPDLYDSDRLREVAATAEGLQLPLAKGDAAFFNRACQNSPGRREFDDKP